MIDLFIRGVPAAQPRTKAVLRGRHAGVYTPKTADGWKTQVSLAVRSLARVDGPVQLSLDFFFERPKGHFGVKGLRPSAPAFHEQKPDTDNLAKSTMDAMVACGFLSDDKRVVRLSISKSWATTEQGCRVRLEELARVEA